MKRSLAMIAILAMIVSLFSGVVFADTTVDCKIDLDQDSVNYSKSFATAKITGRILNSATNALWKTDSTIKVYIDANNNGTLEDDEKEVADVLYSVTASNGTFEITIDTSAHDVANMFVVAEGTGVAFADAAAFRIVRAMEIDGEYTLQFDYPKSGQVVFQAAYTNEDGNTSDDVILAYIDSNNTKGQDISVANFKGTDSVGFLFNGEKFGHVGEIGLFINGVLTLKGEVTAPTLNFEITNSVPRKLGNQDIKFDFDIEDKYLDKDENRLASGYQLKYTVKDSDDNVYTFTSGSSDVTLENEVLVDDNTNLFSDVEKQEKTVSIDFENWASGKYTVKVELVKVGTTVVAEAEKQLTVVNPSRYTLMGWTLDNELENGTFRLQFPENDADHLTDAPDYSSVSDVSEQLEVKEYINNSIKYVNLFEVKVSGCGIDETYANFGTHKVTADGSALYADITPETTGTLTLTIKAYKSADGDAVATFTKTIEITGWNMQISTNSVLVGSENDVVFTITDENGEPVNNAIIKSGSDTLVDGTTTNIVGGVYTYEDDDKDLFDTVGMVPITVTNSASSTKISKTNAIDVIGEEIFTVTSDKDVLINGIEEKIYVTVLDQDGEIVYPSIERFDIATDGTKTPNTAFEIGARKDLDGDGIKEAIAVTVEPTKDQESMIIRATTDAGKKMGQVTLDIQKPEVIMTGATKLTENFNRSFEFKVVDPRDDSVITDNITFVEASDYIADDKLEFETDLNEDAGIFRAEARVTEVDWEQAEKDEKAVNAQIKMGEVVVLEVPVAKANLTATPENIIIGAPTNITLTYTDADGNALEGYKVTLNDEEINTTDEDGKVVYSTSSTSSLSLTFVAETDVDEKTTELKVKSGADTEAPVVEAPETVTTDSAVITIKDNVLVKRLMVNGQPVELYFPKAEVTYVANNLKMGDNTFVVEAIDNKDNYTKEVVTIKREAVTGEVEFQIGVATQYGTPILVEGTTMVPVRFAEELGATIAWNNTTKTATYTLGEKSISVTIGSKTAIVNGENVQVTQTPFINSQNRTMVPLRMIAQELGFEVHWVSNNQPIKIVK
ncbi:hypothetical protein IMX26_11520 [Clostridium sp. 'deep sea']|uniref:stalk domain-containing protein n=1 Tax=Clostridium sp. 'deep sea' TaxID=2779445 RepID=UPI0018964442|nr:stalk domain-containing protein [Clostridium sp. 'deep sea']QOR34118.1 hypothetical protein IMX26_11520 [Clostridium sp. 'deep sea']